LAAFDVPKANPLTIEKVELGRRLFFDKNLSLDRTISCGTCHDPAKGWSNGQRTAEGINGAKGTRNVPTIFNVAYNRVQFWDGRVFSLESQALRPIFNPREMAMPSRAALVNRLEEDPDYPAQFARAFPDGIAPENVAKAIAAFERTVLVGNTPFDRYQAGDEQALSEAAKRGLKVFMKKGNCAACHRPPTFTDIGFHNIGVGMDQQNPDVGLFAINGRQSAFGSFKPPMLRELTKTAPYMHDGSIATLEEVIEFYDKGGIPNPQLSTEMRPLKLSGEEKRDLLAFLVEGLSAQSPTGPSIE
jgi:cytochrome c peroxidase